MNDELRAAAERLRKLYGGQSYHETYGCEQTGGGHQQRDERLLIDAYLSEHLADDAHKRLAKVREKLKEIVVTEGCDAGVVLLSDYGPTHYDAELKCQIYDHAYFSPLGDALVELAALAEGEG